MTTAPPLTSPGPTVWLMNWTLWAKTCLCQWWLTKLSRFSTMFLFAVFLCVFLSSPRDDLSSSLQGLWHPTIYDKRQQAADWRCSRLTLHWLRVLLTLFNFKIKNLVKGFFSTLRCGNCFLQVALRAQVVFWRLSFKIIRCLNVHFPFNKFYKSDRLVENPCLI